jgi:hypothetical protein
MIIADTKFVTSRTVLAGQAPGIGVGVQLELQLATSVDILGK